MASRDTQVLRMRDPMDQWLEAQGFFRKLIAKDGSCLFRAVSEQVFHTQVLHTKVRTACVNFMRRHKDLFYEYSEESLDEHISSMQNPWEWGGELEMRVMSYMYRCDFLVYQELGIPPVKVTCNGFKNKVLLCQLGKKQYDSVYQKEYVKGAAFCQSIVYHMLYDKVFKMEGTDFAVEKMLHDKTVRLRRDTYMTPCSTGTTVKKQNINNGNENLDKLCNGRIEGPSEEIKLSKEWFNNAKEILLQGIIPFPYKVAKALDIEIFRNIEFDVWTEQRKELRWGVSDLLNGGESRDLRVGSKCLVKLDSSPGKELHAHIQEMALEKGPVLVYVEELAKKCIVQFETLEPIPGAISSHSLLRSDRGKHIWMSEKKRISNAYIQNALSMANNSKHYGFQPWRQSSSTKNRINHGRYDNKNGGSGKEGGRSKNAGNRSRSQGTAEEHEVVPVVASQITRVACQPVPLNQEERLRQVLFTNSQLQINLQSQHSESPGNAPHQATPVLGPQNNGILPSSAKQSLPTSSSSNSTLLTESTSTLSPSVGSPCECPSCSEDDTPQCHLTQTIELERVPWNAQPLCYCCYPMVDWRAGPGGGSNHPVPSYLSSCGTGPVPIIQAPPIFPCPPLPPRVCMTHPDSVPLEGRNMPYSEIPGYRVYNVGHDYCRPSYIAYPGSNMCSGQQLEVEGGGAVPIQEEDNEPQQITRTAINVPHSQNECPPIVPNILPSATSQDPAYTAQIGQSDQDFTPHSEEDKPTSYDQSMSQLKHPPPVPVRVPPEQVSMMAERAREESFPLTQANYSPSAEQEAESTLPQNVRRWMDIVRHLPPPTSGSMIHSMPSPYMSIPSQSLSSAMFPYQPPHGGMEPQFYVCAATGPHPSGHHMVYSPFPPHHPMPHPQPHLLPAALHPRYIYQTPNSSIPPNVTPHQ